MLSDPLIYIGGDAGKVQGRRVNLQGPRCYSPVRSCPDNYAPDEAVGVRVLLDSGAFSDDPRSRLSLGEALLRQFRWEARTAQRWQYPSFTCEGFVTYDVLIDETWTGSQKTKQRWDEESAWWAVAETVAAARYFDLQRSSIQPRRLVMACQGVTAEQYYACANEVLAYCQSDDVFGLGGWCIIGQKRRWIPVLWQTCYRIFPLLQQVGISRIHIFGVTYLPVLGRLLWLCDQHGFVLSTDSAAPVLACTWGDPKKAGVRAASGRWEDNVHWWRETIATLRYSHEYRQPANPDWQFGLFG